jgi:hypothetical protein
VGEYLHGHVRAVCRVAFKHAAAHSSHSISPTRSIPLRMTRSSASPAPSSMVASAFNLSENLDGGGGESYSRWDGFDCLGVSMVYRAVSMRRWLLRGWSCASCRVAPCLGVPCGFADLCMFAHHPPLAPARAEVCPRTVLGPRAEFKPRAECKPRAESFPRSSNRRGVMSTRELIDMCSKSAGRRRDLAWALWCCRSNKIQPSFWGVCFRGRNPAALVTQRGEVIRENPASRGTETSAEVLCQAQACI